MHNLIIGSTFGIAKKYADEMLQGKIVFWSQDIYKTNKDDKYEIVSITNVPDFITGRTYDEIHVADQECINEKFMEHVMPRLKDGGLLKV
jgi:hypothetical protein